MGSRVVDRLPLDLYRAVVIVLRFAESLPFFFTFRDDLRVVYGTSVQRLNRDCLNVIAPCIWVVAATSPSGGSSYNCRSLPTRNSEFWARARIGSCRGGDVLLTLCSTSNSIALYDIDRFITHSRPEGYMDKNSKDESNRSNPFKASFEAFILDVRYFNASNSDARQIRRQCNREGRRQHNYSECRGKIIGNDLHGE